MVTVIFAEISRNPNLSMWVWDPHETGKANKNVSEWNLYQSLGKQTFVWQDS